MPFAPQGSRSWRAASTSFDTLRACTCTHDRGSFASIVVTLERSEEPDFLTLLTPEDAAELRARAGTRRFRAGQALMHEGQVGDELMVLVAGRAKVTCTTAEGKEIVLAFLQPGDLLGELSVLDDRPRSSSVVALEPGEALVLAASEFRAVVGSRPRIAFELLRILTRRFRDAERKRIEFAASQTLGRVRSEEHTSELQSPDHLVCRLLLEKKKQKDRKDRSRHPRGRR